MAANTQNRLAPRRALLASLVIGAFLTSPTQAAETTSPEPGGVTVRMARVKAAHDGSSNPTWADIESDGAIWDLVTLSGGTGSGRIGAWGGGNPNHKVRVTLDADGKDPNIGIEVELEAVASAFFQGPMPEGDRTIKVTFGTQTQQTTTVTIDYSVARAANQPTIDTGAVSVLEGSLSGASSRGGAGSGGDVSKGRSSCVPCGCPHHDALPLSGDCLGSGGNRDDDFIALVPANPVSIPRMTAGPIGTSFPVTSPGAGRFTAGGYDFLGTRFSVSYHSRATYFGAPPAGVPAQPFGTALSPMHRFLDPIDGTNNYTYFRGRGEVFHFLEQSGGSYAIDIDEDISLTKNGNNTFTVTLADGAKEEYDTAGKLTGLVDPDGNTWSLSYGTVGTYTNALTKVTEPDGEEIQFTYETDTGRVTKAFFTDSESTWKLLYDTSDNLTKLEETDCPGCGAAQVTRTFTYSSGFGDPLLNGNVLSAENADGVEKLAFLYSTADRSTKATVGVAANTYEHYTEGGIRTLTGPGGFKSVFSRDGQGRVTKVARLKQAPFEPVLAAVSFAYDADDNITKTTLPDNMEIHSVYDTEGRITKETHKKGTLSFSRTWLYDTTLSRATKYTDFRGNSWTYQYNAEGALTKLTAPEVTLGLPASQQAVTQHFYDAAGNDTKVIHPDGTEYELLYAANDLLTKQTSAVGGLAFTHTWFFDDRGRLTKEIDPGGGATTYEYDGFARTKVTSPSGVVTTLEYDVDGNVTRQVQASGSAQELVTTLVYDANERVTKSTLDPGGLGLVTKFFYDADGLLTRTQDPNGDFGPTLKYDELHRLTGRIWGGLTTQYSYDLASRRTKEAGGGAITTWLYDGLGRLTKTTDPLSHYRTFEYDAGGNVTRELSYQSDATLLAEVKHYFDEAGRRYKSENYLDGTTAATSEFLHDVDGRLTKQEDPLDGATTFAYDALDRLTRSTDPAGGNTDSFYDAMNRVTLSRSPLGSESQTFYDVEGRVTKSVDPLSAATTFAYDNLSRLTRTTDPLGFNSDSFYDKAGRLTKSTDPAGGEQTVEYDPAGRQTKVTVKVTATLSRSTTFIYDTLGQLTRMTDPLGNNTDSLYDAWGRVTKTTDAEAVKTVYLFDKAGQLTKSISDDGGAAIEVVTEYDGVGRRTRVLNDSGTAVLRFFYDRLRRQTKLTYANDDAETYEYDIASRRTKLTRPTGDAITYLYDSRGLLTKSTLPGSVEQTFSYDAAGRRTKADDPNTDLSWSYNSAGNLTKVVDGKLSKTITYTFDPTGRLTLDAPEANDTQVWWFDPAGRLTRINENGSMRAEWLYDLAGAPTKMTYGSGSLSTWDYDGGGRLTKLIHKKSDSTVIQSFTYRLDKVGNRTKLTLDGGNYLEFLYDKLYQLTKETRKTSAGALQYENSFYYDRLSNRTKLIYDDGTQTTTTYEYNTADQLTKSTTDGTDTTYSYDANGNRTRKGVGGTNYDYFFDARNLITKYTDGTTTTTYNYDIASRRVKTSVGATTTQYLFDGLNALAEYDGAGALLASYVAPGLDNYISATRGGTLAYYHQDPLGSVWNLTQASDESVQNTYQYQAFGSLFGPATEGISNPYRFTGRTWDSHSSLHHYRARQYDQTHGRFLSRDPLLDRVVNLYTYVSNSPVIFNDPKGLHIDASWDCTYLDHWPETTPPRPWADCRLSVAYPIAGEPCGEGIFISVICTMNPATPNPSQFADIAKFKMSLAGNCGDGWTYLRRDVPVAVGQNSGTWRMSLKTRCGRPCDILECDCDLELYTEVPPDGFHDPPEWPEPDETNLLLRFSVSYTANDKIILSSDVNGFECDQARDQLNPPVQPYHPKRAISKDDNSQAPVCLD